jgi:hypothetical protein
MARKEGVTDMEIHDTTVQIAAGFYMYNRHVAGLGTLAHRNNEPYADMGEDGECWLWKVYC